MRIFLIYQWPTGANSYQKNTVCGVRDRFLEIDFFGFLGEKKWDFLKNLKVKKIFFPHAKCFKFHQWPTGANSYQKNIACGVRNRFLEMDFFGFLGDFQAKSRIFHLFAHLYGP